jgi:phytoene/squalene synthetase
MTKAQIQQVRNYLEQAKDALALLDTRAASAYIEVALGYTDYLVDATNSDYEKYQRHMASYLDPDQQVPVERLNLDESA